MKKIFLSISISFAALITQAQVVPGIWAGNDTTVPCGSMVDLHATLVGTGVVGNVQSYNVVNIPYAPDPFLGPTTLPLGDDQWSAPIAMPFCFNYWGNNYSTCWIGSNGCVTFTAPASTYCPWPISVPVPSASDPMNTIMIPWEDIYLAGGGQLSYATYGVAPFRRFTVSWNNASMYSCTGFHFTGQVILYESTNVIETHIQQKLICASWNSGRAIHAVHDIAGATAVVVSNPTLRNSPIQWAVAAPEGIRFDPVGPACTDTIKWYNNGVLIGIGPTITVGPMTITDTFVCVLVTNCPGGCGIAFNTTDTVIVNVVNSLSANLISVVDVSCNGGSDGSITVAANGGVPPITYTWNTVPPQNTPAATGLPAGTYTCMIQDAFGCPATITATVNEPPALVITSTSSTDPTCFGGTNGTATVNPSGGTPGYTYQWSTAPPQFVQTATGLSAGNYSVNVFDSHNCLSVANFVINQPAQIQVATASVDVTCFGGNNGSAQAVGSAGQAPYSYLWNTAPPQPGQLITNLTAGVYTVTVTDGNGCTVTGTATVNQGPPMTIGMATINVSCNGGNDGSISASPNMGTAPYLYTWNTTPGQIGPTAISLSAGTYTVNVTDAIGCTGTASATVTEPTIITCAITETNSSCPSASDGTLTAAPAGGSPGYTYFWSPSGGTSATATGLSAGSYSVLVTDANGCAATFSGTVVPNANFTVDVADTVSIILGLSTQFQTTTSQPANGTFSYMWNPSQDLDDPTIPNPTATPSVTTTYTVTVVDMPSGCLATDTIQVIVIPTQFCLMPQAFTPNGNGMNDELYPIVGSLVTVKDFRIYNRWGRLIWNNPNKGWNGTVDDLPAPVETYVWYIVYETPNHPHLVISGSTSLMR